MRRGKPSAQGDSQERARGLLTTLDKWVAALLTVVNLDVLMGFYAPTVNGFYQRREATQAAVRAEKTACSRRLSRLTCGQRAVVEVAEDGQAARCAFVSPGTSRRQPRSGESYRTALAKDRLRLEDRRRARRASHTRHEVKGTS